MIFLKIIFNVVPAFLWYVLAGPSLTILVFVPIIALQLPLAIYKRIGFAAGSFTLIYGLMWLDSENAKHQMEKICKEEGGLKIYGRLENVKGVAGIGVDKEALFASGFQFIESGPGLNPQLPKYSQLRRQPDGSVIETRSETPEAEVVVSFKNGGMSNIFVDVVWMETSVFETSSKRLLGQYRYIYKYGGITGRIEQHYSVLGIGSGRETQCPVAREPSQLELVNLVVTPASLSSN